MSSLVGSLIQRVLTKYLSEYFTYGKLEVKGIGEYHLVDLELRPEIVPANLAVKVRTCSLHAMHIKVHPLQLFSLSASYAISVTIDTLKIVIEERPEEEWDERAEFEALKATKLALIQQIRDQALQSIETKLASLDGNLVPKTSESSLMGLVKNLAVRFAGNFELEVKGVEVAYHFEGTDRSGHVGLKVQGFRLENTSLSPRVEIARNNANAKNANARGDRVGDDADLSPVAQEDPGIADDDVYVAGILVEPVQGATERIVKKQIRIEGVEVYLQRNEKAGVSTRSKLVNRFNMESVLAVNLASDPRPTLGIVELRVSHVAVAVSPHDLAALTYLGDSLTHQVRWKLWCSERFAKLVQTGITTQEQAECFKVYEKMFEKGKQDVGPRTRAPKKAAPAASGIDSLLADMSWIHKCELRSHPETIRTILNSVASIVAKREKEKILEQIERGQKPSITTRISGAASSWIGWATGSNDASSKADDGTSSVGTSSVAGSAPRIKTEDEIRNMAKSAQELSSALGISSDADNDAKKIRKHRRKIFDSMDKDKSGDVDVVELQVGLAMAGTTLSPKKVHELISTFDTNLDGSIDFEEFCTMCDLAPGRLGSSSKTANGTESQSKPDVLALSFTVQGFEAVIFADEPHKCRAENKPPPLRIVAALNEICTAVAVEGAMNPMVGMRSLNVGVRKIAVDLYDGHDKLALLAPKAFATRMINTVQAGRQSIKDENAETEIEDDMDLAESRFSVRVLSLKLSENDVAPTLSPYCSLYYLDEFEDTLDEQTTALVDGASCGKPDEAGFSEYNFRSQSPVIPPLDFIVGHGRTERKAHVQIQVRQRQDNSSWVRRMVRRNLSSVDPVESDLVLCALDVRLPVRAIAKDEFSRIGTQMYRDFEEWYELPGGFGKVLLRVECAPSGPSTVRAPTLPLSTPKSSALSTLFEFEAKLNQSVMYFDVAAGVTVPKFYINLHPELLPWTDKLSGAFSADNLAKHAWTPGAAGAASNEAHPAWRCEKVLLDVGVTEMRGIDTKKARIVSTRLLCGAEKLGVEGMLANENLLTLGETQNLFQLEFLKPQAQIEVAFELGSKRTIKIEGLTLHRVLEDVRKGRKSLLFWCNTTEAGVRVRVSIDVSSPDFVIEDDGDVADADISKENTAEPIEPSIAMPPSWQQQGQLAQDPPQAEWAKWVQADPFGLMTFPPLLQQNIAYLNVQVVSARGLRAADFNGKSDPYCVLTCQAQESRTHVVPKTLTPSWEDKPQTSQFRFGPLPGSALDPSSYETLDLRVMDEDFGGEWTHDLLGVAHVPLHDLYDQVVRAPNEQQQQQASASAPASGSEQISSRPSSKRYSQRPASQAEINPERSVTMWIPLHMQDSAAQSGTAQDSDEPDGAVQVRIWLEPCGESRRPQSVIPVALDMTMLMDVAMPAIRIPRNHELNASRKTIEISLGRPSMSMRVNNGASNSLVESLRIHADHRETLHSLQGGAARLQHHTSSATNAARSRPGMPKRRSTSQGLPDPDTESDFFSVAERAQQSDTPELAPTASVSTNLDDFHSIATAGDEDIVGDSEGELSAPRRLKSAESEGPRVRKVQKSVMADLDFALGFYVDAFEVRVGFTHSRQGARDFLRLAADEFSIDAMYSLYDCGLPLIKLSMQAKKFEVEDKWQSHPIIGDHLEDVYDEMESELTDMERRRLRKARQRRSLPQFRLSLIYQRNAVAEDQRQELGTNPVPSLLFGIDLEGMYVLVTPLFDFSTKLASAFGLLNDDDGLQQPEVVTELQEASENAEEPKDEEAKQDEAKAKAKANTQAQSGAIQTTAPGSVLPVSKVRVLVRTSSIELHLMQRQTLCLETRRRLHKFPPKAMIFRVGSEIKYTAIARPFDKDSRALPGSEMLKIRATCDARIAPTKIARNCFQRLPEDIYSGDNVILEPFTFNMTMKTNSIDTARDLRLARRLQGFGDSEKSDMDAELDSFFNTSSGSHFELPEEEPPRLDSSKNQEESGSIGQIRDLRAEDIWGVNSHTVMAQQKMRDELQRAKESHFTTVRIFEIRLDGLEARLDTGDVNFVLAVGNKQLEMYANLFPPPNTGKDAGDGAPRNHAESTVSRRESAARSEHANSMLSTNASESGLSLDDDGYAGVSPAKQQQHMRVLTAADIQLMSKIKSNLLHGQDDDILTQNSGDTDEGITVGDPGVDDLGTSLEGGKEMVEKEREARQPGTYETHDFEALNSSSEPRLFNAEDAAPNPRPKKTDGNQSLLPGWLLAGMVPMLVMCSDTEAFRRRLPGDTPGHWNTERDAEVLGHLSSEASRGAVTELVFNQINVYVNQLMLGIGNNIDGYPTPFLRLSLAQFNLIGCSRTLFTDDMQIRGYISTTSTYYNSFVRAWEPVIEPWSLLLQGEHSKSTSGRLFQAIAPRRLNVNITDAFLKSMTSFLGSLGPTYSPLDDERLHGMYTPNWVVNETGHALELWPVNKPGGQMRSLEPRLLEYRGQKQIYHAETSEALRLHLHDTTRIRAKMAELLNHMRENKRRLVFKTVKYLRNAARRHREARENDPNRNLEAEKEKRASFMKKFAQDDVKDNEEQEEQEEDLRKDLTELFRFMDEDDSGEISCVELQNALSHYGEPISVEEVLYSIGEMDDEGVENVDAAETGIDLGEFLDFFMPSLLESPSKPAPGLDVHAIGFRVIDLEGKGSHASSSTEGVGDDEASSASGGDQVVAVPLPDQIGIAPSENAGQFMLQTAAVVALGHHDTKNALGGRGKEESSSSSEIDRTNADGGSKTSELNGNDDDDNDDDDENSDDGDLTPAQSPEDEEKEREERRRSKHLTAFQLKGKSQERGYSFHDRNMRALSVVANVQKIGRSSAGDVLFLETPIRVENRTIVPFRVNFVCHGPDGGVLYEDAMFTLSPGDEQSIPLKYLYARQLGNLHGGDCGFSVSPLMDRGAQQRIWLNKRGERAQEEKRTRGRTLSVDSTHSNQTADSAYDDWTDSGVLVALEGGQGLRVRQPFRARDDLLTGEGNLLNDLLVRDAPSRGDGLDSDIVGASRVVFYPREEEDDDEVEGGQDSYNPDGHQQSQSSHRRRRRRKQQSQQGNIVSLEDLDELDAVESGQDLANRAPDVFECVMLTQRNALHRYEMKEILTVQVLQASNLMSADANNSSDPFVIVSSLDGKTTVEKFKTPVIRKTLNPIWANKSTFRFGEGKEPLSRQRRLRFSVVDWDALTSNDPLGYVTLDVKDIVSWFSAGHGVKTARGVVKKTFMLEAGRGVSDKEVKGSLTVEFSYKRYAAATGTPKQYLQHVFSFYPPLVLENLLPHPIDIALEVLKKDSKNEEVVSRHKVHLIKGGRAPFHEMDGALLDYLNPNWVRHHSARASHHLTGKPDGRALASDDGLIAQVRVRMHTSEGPTAWSDPLNSDSLGVPLSDPSMKDRPVCSVSAEVERKTTQDGGGRRLVICAPFWAVNKSDLILDWTISLSSKKKKLQQGRTETRVWDHLPQSIAPFFAPAMKRSVYGEARSANNPGGPRFTAPLGKCIMDDDSDETKELQSGLPVYVPLFANKLPGPEQFPGFEVIVMAARVEGLHENAEAVALSCSVQEEDGSHLGHHSYTAAVPGGSSREWPFASGFLSVSAPASQDAKPVRGNLVLKLREVSESSATSASAILQAAMYGDNANASSGNDNGGTGANQQNSKGKTESSNTNSTSATAFDSLYAKNPESYRALGEARISLPELVKELLVKNVIERELKIGEAKVVVHVSLAGVPVDERLISLYSSLSSVVGTSAFRRDIGVSLMPLYGTYSRTSLLTIGPKYRIANVTDEPLLVKQGGCPDSTAILLKPRDPALHSNPNDLSDVKVFCFHYQLTPGTRFQVRDDPSRKVYTAAEYIQVRLATADGIWSEPIGLDGLDDFALQLRAGPERKRAARVWVDDNESLPSKMLIFRTLDVDEVDHTIRNKMPDRSFEVIQIPSRSVGLKAAVMRCFKPLPGASKLLRQGFPPDVVKPGEELSLPLDRAPEEGLRTHILIIPLREDGSRDLDFAKTIRYKPGLVLAFPQRKGEDLALTVRRFGLRSSVVISEMTSRARKKAAEAEGESLTQFVKDLTPKRPSYEFLMELSSTGLSLFNSKRGLEVLYVCAQRVHLEGALEYVEEYGSSVRSQSTLEFAVGHFQIDSSQVQAKYPVMMFAREPKAKAVRERESEPILCAVSELATERTLLLSKRQRYNRAINDYIRIQVAYESGGASSSFDIVKLVTLSMHKVEVKIDSILLAGVFQVIDPLLMGTSSEGGSIEGEGAVLGSESETSSWGEIAMVMDIMTGNVTIPAQDTIFCERIRVSPTAFITSVNLGSSSELEDTLRQFGIPMAFYGIIKRFSRLENFSFDLSHEYEDAITSHKFQSRYIAKITRAVLTQMHEYFLNKGKQLVPFLHAKHDHEKIREPLVPSGGVLVHYGPGPKPSIIESEREKAAFEVLERSFLQYLERKRKGFPAEMRPQQDDQNNKSSKKHCFGCGSS
ncbi:Synaptotagmin-C [Hondaea fermentalgiana]|uniref:Synaptotagmin-C n=1 Tax=Hondaea fermentalgiana TaxID=2315210 RepID=A0A2R5G9W4_9STRA|nr:Synaptotagmin-C [Hondaea fermentalgiana]|eukprot:GBG27842.1 Synaptotagmin-C [Hondaea fermentalgiana]